jgi:inner membrane protein
MLGVTATFIAGGQLATRGIDAIAAAEFHNDRIIDHVLSPGPMNPLCWNVLLLETNGDRYVVRRGMVSVAPALIPASRCPAMSGNLATTAPLAVVGAPDSAAIHWLGEFAMSKTVLAQVVAGNCNAAALMQFARAPFVTTEPDWVIGDLRFPGGRGGGMADIDLKSDSPRPCPQTPPWTPPRAELLH